MKVYQIYAFLDFILKLPELIFGHLGAAEQPVNSALTYEHLKKNAVMNVLCAGVRIQDIFVC